MVFVTFSELAVRCYVLVFQARRIMRRITGRKTTVYVWDRIAEYRDLWTQASRIIDADIVEVDDGVWLASRGGKECWIANHCVELDNPVVLKIAGNKPLTHSLLQQSGIPTAKFSVFTLKELGRLREFVGRHRGMFVIKPAVGSSSGIGVTTHLKGFDECLKAAALASLHGRHILIETLLPGEIYRLLVLDGKVIGAVRRDGKYLTGDGVSNVRELLIRDYQSAGSEIPDISEDRDLEAMLHAQGESLNSVLPAGQKITAKTLSEPTNVPTEIRTIYTANVLHLVCEEIQDIAVRACKAIGSRFAGVDIITMDPTRPLKETGGAVVEINTTPGLHHHYNLRDSQLAPDPAPQVLSAILETVILRDRDTSPT
jgi:cyanophycin synthetase